MSGGEKGRYTPGHKRENIEADAKLLWQGYQSAPSDEYRKQFMSQLLDGLRENNIILNNVDVNNVSYETFVDVFRDKDTIERARKIQERLENQQKLDAEQKKKEDAQKEAEKKLEEDILSEEDTGVDSQSVKDSCEECDADKLKCLCHVDMTSSLREKKYEWKAGSGGELANNAVIIGMHGPGEAYAPFKLDFSIKSSECRGAKGSFPDKCTNLYYYEQDVHKKLMGEIDEKGKEGTLNLEFHKDYLDKDKKLSPHYLKAREDMTAAQQEEDNKSGGLSFVPSLSRILCKQFFYK